MPNASYKGVSNIYNDWNLIANFNYKVLLKRLDNGKIKSPKTNRKKEDLIKILLRANWNKLLFIRCIK